MDENNIKTKTRSLKDGIEFIYYNQIHCRRLEILKL